MSRQSSTSRVAVFPGSFDPFTQGHANLVDRALQLFDELVIVVGYNINKPGWIPVDERVRALQAFYSGNPSVTVTKHNGLTVDLAKELGARHILRGVRTVKDYEYELQMADINRRLTGIDTLLLPALPQYASLSSSVARELVFFGHTCQNLLPEGLQYNT